MKAQTKISLALKATQFTEDQAEFLAEELYNAVAHELAEEIRNSKRLRDYTDDHMSDCNMAADEIDPEVEK